MAQPSIDDLTVGQYTTAAQLAEPEKYCADLIKKRTALRVEYDAADTELVAKLRELAPFFAVKCNVDSQSTYYKEWTIGVFCGEARAIAYAERLVEYVDKHKNAADVKVWLGVYPYEVNHYLIQNTAPSFLEVSVEDGFKTYKDAIQHYNER
jgi:hypothetical protein